jgi:pimeloyl-ACP methyl ester carboxylesterase
MSARAWIAALVAALGLAPALAPAQADYERERRWAEEITPGIVVGDAVYLETATGRRFLALWTPRAGARAGVIVVHGLGLHPDWGLIGALRSGLAEQGYATLSVQMPVASREARADRYPPLFPEAAERLRAAVAFLRGNGLAKIVIVSHSMGSRMADYFLHRAPDAGLAAWVAIGMAEPYSGLAAPMPVLDLYGEKDNAGVLETALARAAVLRGSKGSAQIEVAGADHFFEGREADLVRRVRQFLDSRVRP